MSKKQILLISVSISASFLLSGCSFPRTTASVMTEKGILSYQQGAFLQAHEELKQSVDTRRRNAQSRYYLGEVEIALEKYQEATNSLETARNLGFSQVDIERSLGKIAMNQNKYDNAVKNYTNAINSGEPSAEDYSNLGLAYYYYGDYKSAHENFDNALEKDSKHFKTLLNKGTLLADSGELELSLKYFDAATQIDPENLAVVYNKATVLSDLSYNQKVSAGTGFALLSFKALQLFDYVIERQPDYISAYTFKGITYYDLENYEEALFRFNEALIRDEEAIDALFYQGRTFTKMNKYEKAQESFQAVLDIEPSNQQAQQELIDLERIQ